MGFRLTRWNERVDSGRVRAVSAPTRSLNTNTVRGCCETRTAARRGQSAGRRPRGRSGARGRILRALADARDEGEEEQAEASALWAEIFPAQTAGYDRCRAAAERAEGERSTTVEDTRFFYGEADLVSMEKILNVAGVNDGDAFVDLGSGAGKAVVAAALLRPRALSSARGIEMLPDLHTIAMEARSAYALAMEASCGGAHVRPQVDFVLGDMLSQPLVDVQIVYVFATTFPRSLVLEIEMKLSAELRVGARVCLVSKVFENTFLEWEEVGTAPLYQPLGNDERPVESHAALTVTVYRKVA